MIIRRKTIRNLVRDLLVEGRVVTPPVDVESIAHRLGAVIQPQTAADSLSGFLVRDRSRGRTIIGVNSTHHKNRQRFTIAHEIGHLLLHKGETVHVDEGTRVEVKLRSDASSSEMGFDEAEANFFAAELLMPTPFLEAELKHLRTVDLADDQVLRDLAEKYQVSTQALSIRLTNLGYIRL